jgi:transcriptional regulator with XRE-family HTH domain
MNTESLQQQLFKQIRSLLPANLSLADEVADLLGISPDSAYRRIRGEKSISFEELQKLAEHFQISLDAILKINSKSTVFYGDWLNANNFNFQDYLNGLLAYAQSVNRGSRKMIYYEAKDFPPFHYFHFPELAAFKYFFWMKTILNYPECTRMHYEDNELGGILQKTGSEIMITYNQVPTAEIWSAETINSTVRQIEYYRDAGVFRKKESIDQLYGQLTALLDHVRDQAECGEKLALGQKPFGGPQFQLYYNEAYLGHNTIMTETDGVETVYINHGVLNLMMTHDKEFCTNTRRYFENTMKKSSLISGVNDKERHRFFNAMHEKIAMVRDGRAGQDAGGGMLIL